ncbi:MAG: putative repeat protein (TIGR03806 family) [Planctomycetota bacterium]|jgi:uncharacterized repeat protein (TIGR03806 family)
MLFLDTALCRDISARCARLIACCSFGLVATAQPQEEAGGVGLERIFSRLRFERPVFLTGAGDGSGRLFVTEQDGVIRCFDATGDPGSSEVFLDIRERVSRQGNEEGLIGLAFHPGFADNGSFFVHYSSSIEDEVGIVSRFQVSADDPNRADVASEQVVLRQPQPWRNHNGGMIAFGPDGYLYISFGDGGAADDPQGNGQKLSSWLGSILRIDIDHKEDGLAYAIPEDNPFAGAGSDVRPEIFAFGLRNVWRFSFDRETADLWAADVGQNLWEEVDLIESGGNYGWRSREGFESFDADEKVTHGDALDPVAVYPRSEGISITGGYAYRGTRYPELSGMYFYGDYASGNMWRIRPDAESGFKNELVRRTGRSIASFGEDDEGELFLLSFDGGIYRIVPTQTAEDTFADWPLKLSETGLYEMGRNPSPAAHLIPYEVNAPFWSDGAQKERFFVLPEGASFGYSEDGSWDVPAGATLVKTFRDRTMGRESNLETRLIRRTDTGWEAATYVWAQGRGLDATLVPEGKQFEMYKRSGITTWHAPSASECSACHIESAGYALGITTAQLNRMDAGGEFNQVLDWAAAGMLTLPDNFDPQVAPSHPRTDDASVSLEARSRTWLDVNCSSCHQPEGRGNAAIDLRLATALDATGIMKVAPAQGDFDIEDALLIAPGDAARSVLLHRIETLGDGRMPNIGSNQVDSAGVKLIREWIESLED